MLKDSTVVVVVVVGLECTLFHQIIEGRMSWGSSSLKIQSRIRDPISPSLTPAVDHAARIMPCFHASILLPCLHVSSSRHPSHKHPIQCTTGKVFVTQTRICVDCREETSTEGVVLAPTSSIGQIGTWHSARMYVAMKAEKRIRHVT
jgi:hypothetical protein